MKRVLKISATAFLIIILAAGIFLFYLSRGLNEKIDLTGIDMTDVDDGVYQGSYENGRWTNMLNVEVHDHMITDISIVDDVTLSSKKVNTKLFDKVKESQSTKVDMISGATVTSRAYLKSVENSV